ncbi:MAG: alpha-glucan family phosphorylase, partial [Fidelibacterota bacterium]
MAGDHIKAAADAGLPLCGITLLYKEGYFKQRVDESGCQTETYPRYDPEPLLKKLPVSLSLPLRGRTVAIHVYELIYMGLTGHEIPVYFLDTDVDENETQDRIITLRLYSGDKDHRILQEAILGFGGVLLLETLGYNQIKTYHMNEGHCAFLTLELLKKFKGDKSAVRSRCHFTTHTPVPSGHDNFAISRCRSLLDGLIPENLGLPSMIQNERLHLTELGLHFSRSANAVSKLHCSVAQK